MNNGHRAVPVEEDAQAFLNWCYTHNRGNCIGSKDIKKWSPEAYADPWRLRALYQYLDAHLQVIRVHQKTHNMKIWRYTRPGISLF